MNRGQHGLGGRPVGRMPSLDPDLHVGSVVKESHSDRTGVAVVAFRHGAGRSCAGRRGMRDVGRSIPAAASSAGKPEVPAPAPHGEPHEAGPVTPVSGRHWPRPRRACHPTAEAPSGVTMPNLMTPLGRPRFTSPTRCTSTPLGRSKIGQRQHSPPRPSTARSPSPRNDRDGSPTVPSRLNTTRKRTGDPLCTAKTFS
jgi:hypothetical protein